MNRHKNCLLCTVGWPRDHHPEPLEQGTEAEDEKCPYIDTNAGLAMARNRWIAYMEDTLDMAIEAAS